MPANFDISPLVSLTGTIITGLLTLLGVYVMIRPALAKVVSENAKNDSETDLNNVKTANELQEMMKEMYEERIHNLEMAWDRDKKKIVRLENAIMEQFTMILKLLRVIKESRIILPAELKEQVEALIASRPTSDLFTEEQ